MDAHKIIPLNSLAGVASALGTWYDQNRALPWLITGQVQKLLDSFCSNNLKQEGTK